MKKALFAIAILLVIVWGFGYFMWNAGNFIHVLAIIAAIAWMQAIIYCPRKVQS